MLVSLESDTLQNLFQISDRIFSGGEPRGEKAFEQLAQLGVRTIVSVDGVQPDLKLSKQHGLRYVHVPIGYDGIEAHASLSIVRAMQETEGGVYFHCHHGRHRGPAAAAIACMTDGPFGPDTGLKILNAAGTSCDYSGLWRDVQAFQPVSGELLWPELVEQAQVEDLTEAMAKMDRIFDRLMMIQSNGWKTPEWHSDLEPEKEALMLRESFHEIRRMRTGAGNQLLADFEKAEQEVRFLEDHLHRKHLDHATRQLQQIKQTCKNCHQRHRDGN